MTIPRGTMVWLEPDPAPLVGHEQDKGRPAVVVSDERIINSLRFAMLGVVVLTSTQGLDQAFYPLLKRRPGGLTKDCFALPDQIRAVDKKRVTKRIGFATASELAAIDASLRLFLKLPGPNPNT